MEEYRGVALLGIECHPVSMPRVLVWSLCVAVAIAMSGCGGEPEASADCSDADPALLAAIEAGAQDDTGMQVKSGAFVKSPDHEQVYVVAAVFSAAGVDEQTGVWATNASDGSGLMMSADAMAKQFTTWPDASTTDAAIREGDPVLETATGCLK